MLIRGDRIDLISNNSQPTIFQLYDSVLRNSGSAFCAIHFKPDIRELVTEWHATPSGSPIVRIWLWHPMFQELDPASVICKQLVLIRLICITHGVWLSPPSSFDKTRSDTASSGRARRTGTDPVLMSKRSTPLENDGAYAVC